MILPQLPPVLPATFLRIYSLFRSGFRQPSSWPCKRFSSRLLRPDQPDSLFQGLLRFSDRFFPGLIGQVTGKAEYGPACRVGCQYGYINSWMCHHLPPLLFSVFCSAVSPADSICAGTAVICEAALSSSPFLLPTL